MNVLRAIWKPIKWTLTEARGAAVAAVTAAAVAAVLGVVFTRGGHHVATTTAPLRPSPPLTFSVVHLEEGFVVVDIPRTPGTLAAMKSAHGCMELERVARLGGGADPRRTILRVLVHGHRADDVTITGIRAVIVSRGRPKAGAEAFCAGGGELGDIPVSINLEARNPIAQRFLHHVTSVAKGEVVSFNINAHTRSQAIAWKLVVSAELASGHKLTYVLQDTSHPFRTTPYTDGTPTYEWRWWRLVHKKITPKLVVTRHSYGGVSLP
jgi:hypothetical protein